MSPTETIYWLRDVLVSLALVIDSEPITKAVSWGIEQGQQLSGRRPIAF